METLLRDIRFGARTMARRPGATAITLLTFSLGIAASTAMFSVIDAVLLRPLPYPEPESIVSVYTTNPAAADLPAGGFGTAQNDAVERGWFSYPEFRTLLDTDGVFDGLAALAGGGAVLYGAGEPERIPLGRTTSDLFGPVLRVTPLIGRVFDEDDARSGERVVVLTEGFWRRRFGADTAVVGNTVMLDETPHTIIGVLPAHVRLAGFDVDGWRLMNEDDNWGNHWLRAIGRLAPGVTAQQANARLSSILGVAMPAGHWTSHGVNTFPRLADRTRRVRGPLRLLGLASLLLLVVACGNVAALLIGAAIDREQELAVRAALGAGRGRLVRQLLTESAALSLVAAAAGVLLAGAATRGLLLIAPEGVPRIDEAVINVRVSIFGVALSMACGILFGLIPALGFSRTDLRRSISLATRGSTASRARVQGAVVIAELALATLLLVGAGLLARTMLALNATDPGFAASRTLALRTWVPTGRITRGIEGDSAQAVAYDAFTNTLLEELRAIPGVRGVAITSNLPLTPDRANNDVQLEGYTELLVAERRFVSHDYFDVMGIRIVQGRAFTPEEDRPGAHPELPGPQPGAVVISEGLARTAWPDESPIGKRFVYWGSRENIVVGVAADIRDEAMLDATMLSFYAPRRQAGQLGGSFVIRTDGDPLAYVPAIRQRVGEVNDAIAIDWIRPLTELIADDIAAERYRARLILVFAGLAALFAVMGIYGVTARSVASRTRELGLRMAIGCPQYGILGLVLRQAIRLAVIGGTIGILLSLIATRGIEAYLWGVERTDPVTLVAIAALLAVASVLAALPPGRRAARVDPMIALRSE